jgi:hypothetical protein
MHPPPPAQGLHQKAAIGAVETMEDTMRVLTIIELMRLTRMELCDLLERSPGLSTITRTAQTNAKRFSRRCGTYKRPLRGGASRRECVHSRFKSSLFRHPLK